MICLIHLLYGNILLNYRVNLRKIFYMLHQCRNVSWIFNVHLEQILMLSNIVAFSNEQDTNLTELSSNLTNILHTRLYLYISFKLEEVFWLLNRNCIKRYWYWLKTAKNPHTKYAIYHKYIPLISIQHTLKSKHQSIAQGHSKFWLIMYNKSTSITRIPSLMLIIFRTLSIYTFNAAG